MDRDGNDLPGAETNSITADPEGSYRCRVTAANAAGATSQTSSAHAIDTTPPETTINSGPSGTTADNDPSFAFSSEPGASFECRLDGPGAATGTFASCTSPKHYTDLADGGYTFQVQATDPVPQRRPDPGIPLLHGRHHPAARHTPPKTTITRQPKRKIKTKKRSVRVRVSFSSEAGATFECRLDRADFEPCSSPYRVKVRFEAQAAQPRRRQAGQDLGRGHRWRRQRRPSPPS